MHVIDSNMYYYIQIDGKSLDIEHRLGKTQAAYDRLFHAIESRGLVNADELALIKQYIGNIHYNDVSITLKGRRAFELAATLDEILPGASKAWREEYPQVIHNVVVLGTFMEPDDLESNIDDVVLYDIVSILSAN